MIARGLPNPASQSVLVGVGLAIAEPLEPKRTTGASEAAALAIRLATGMIDAVAARDGPACRKGCDHCCHFAISATAPEVFYLATALRGKHASVRDITARIRERRSETSGMSLDALMAASLPCPLLVDGACASYQERPIVCRQFMSRSTTACASARAGEPTQIPTLGGAINAGVLCRNLLLAAVRTRGLDERCYELTSALDVALTMNGAEQRWLAGEDVLASALIVPRPSAASAMVERIAEQMLAVSDPRASGRN